MKTKNRYQKLFKRLNNISEGCLVPFIVLGDPTIQTSLEIIDTLISSGADALEVGIPFSDPMADGLTIQNSNLRALSNNINLNMCFSMIKSIRKKYEFLPIGMLIYANLIYQHGIEEFYLSCSKNEVDSVLIADVPIQEYNSFLENSKTFNVNPIFMCPSDADLKFIKLISQHAQGYIYLLSRPGVTGVRNYTEKLNFNLINNLKKFTSVPLLQGFGIKNEDQIKNIISSGVSGIICGSVIINLIEKYYKNEYLMIFKIKNLIKLLKQSTIK